MLTCLRCRPRLRSSRDGSCQSHPAHTTFPCDSLVVRRWYVDFFPRLEDFSNPNLAVFSNASPSVISLAYNQLILAAPLVEGRSSGLHLSLILTVMLRLGASREAIESHVFTMPSASPLSRVNDHAERARMVSRLISIINAYAQ